MEQKITIDEVTVNDGVVFSVQLKMLDDGVEIEVRVPSTCEEIFAIEVAMPMILREVRKATDNAHQMYHFKQGIEHGEL